MKQKGKFLWVLVIVLTLAFVFGQSFMDKSASSKESRIVREKIVQPVYEAITGKTITDSEIRNAAHIIEFTVLGLELALLFKGKKRLLRSISYCGMIALLDESVQLLNDRAPQVTDIWSDILGGTIGALIGILLLTLIRKHSEKTK